MRILLAAAAALALGACASTNTASTPTGDSPPAGRDCFRAASANGFGIVDDHHVRVSVGPSRHYILTTVINTNSLDWSRAIALDGPAYICTGNGLGVLITGGEPRQTYAVREIIRDPADSGPQGS